MVLLVRGARREAGAPVLKFMTLKITVHFVGGTTFEVDADEFRVDTAMRVLAVVAKNESFVFPMENLRYWVIAKKGVVQ